MREPITTPWTPEANQDHLVDHVARDVVERELERARGVVRRKDHHKFPAADRMNAALAWVPIIAAALGLRLFQIGSQILIDDELHALVKLSTSDYRGIATTLGLADHSIPLTLFYKWVAEQGRLSEAWMLGPPWIAGVAACVFAVWVARRHASRLERLTFAGLLAVCPLIVLYTRQARPYAITLFLALVAIWAAWRWSQDGRKRYLALHVLAGVAAVYFHMIVAPFVFGVWVHFLAEWLLGDRRDVRRLALILGMGALCGLLAAALLGPAVVNDWGNLEQKVGAERPTLYSIWRTAQMLAGTTWPVLLGVLVALGTIGARVLWIRHPRATRFVVSLVLLQVVCIFLSGALWLNHALVMSRYLLVALPFALFAVTVGFAWGCERLFSGQRWLAAALAAALILDLYASGPLPAALSYPNAFFGHYVYFFDFDPAHNEVVPVLKPGPMPAFYRALGKMSAGSKTLIEAPWRFESIFNREPYFQEVHRQHVEIGMVGTLCPPGAFAEQPRSFRNKFRHFIDLSRPVEELRKRADYVVFHRNLELSNMTKPWMTYGSKALPAVDACIADFRQRIGNPVFEDETITVFDLGRR
jgi:hypothetical protein